MHLVTLSADASATYAANEIDAMGWSRGCDQPGQDPGTIHLNLYPDMRHQAIAGVGGSFSEVGSDYLAVLPEETRRSALAALFGVDQAAFTFCRTPIGASDFARDAYSLSEVADDHEQKHFSLARDRDGIMRFILGALREQPALRIHASPWSPPGWMKTTGTMIKGGHLRDDCRDAYARYFVRLVQEYAAAGIPIARVLPQNEPDIATPYPSCVMLPEHMVPFVTQHLAPALRAAGLATEVWGGTFRMIGGLQGHECLRDPAFRQAIGGVGYQYSFPDTLAGLRTLHPGLRLMHTESVCHDGRNTWQQAAMLFDDVLGYMRAGCEVFTYWNMVLDQAAKSTWGWRQNSLITIDLEKKTWQPNPDLAIMRLFGRHLQPGAVRVEAFSFQRPVLAVQRPDGRLAAFVANHEAIEKPLKVHLGSKTWREILPPRSFAAIELPAD